MLISSGGRVKEPVSDPDRRGDQRPFSRGLAGWLVLLPLLVFVVSGLRGLDFGFHWDESYHVGTLQEALEEGTILPGKFRYPSVSHWLCVAALAPELLSAPSEGTLREHLILSLEAQDYLLRVRAIFLVVTALALVPLFALVWSWRGPLEAWLAASLLGGSWEVAYHARWLAPDGVLVTLAAVVLLGAVRACLEPARRGSLVMAALAAGAACGTKWPAALQSSDERR